MIVITKLFSMQCKSNKVIEEKNNIIVTGKKNINFIKSENENTLISMLPGWKLAGIFTETLSGDNSSW